MRSTLKIEPVHFCLRLSLTKEELEVLKDLTANEITIPGALGKLYPEYWDSSKQLATTKLLSALHDAVMGVPQCT